MLLLSIGSHDKSSWRASSVWHKVKPSLKSLIGGSSRQLHVALTDGRDGLDTLRLKNVAEDAIDEAEDV